MYPKQFIRLLDGQGPTFLGATLRRLKREAGFAAPTLISNNNHRFLVREELEQAHLSANEIILEPVARNTAPAIAVAALAVMETDPDGVLVVMPSDHAIQDEARFVEAVRLAANVAALGKLVLFGIKPTSPRTEYGYIRQGAALDGFDDQAFEVAAFAEKPDADTAQRYLDEGGYFWNSGLFVFSAQAFLREAGRLAPEVVGAARSALAGAKRDLGFLRLDEEAFGKSPNISIDYAVMEKTDAAVMLPLDVGWSDVGSWASLWEIGSRDGQDNYAHGDTVLEDSSGLYVHSDRSLVAAIGVKDLVIVDTPDALLVADRARAQEVSKIVARLKQSDRKEHEQHLRNYRPWGYFETLSVGPRFQVKLLHVKPGGKLSMQRHHHRSEHWVVVQGTAKVTVGDTETLVRENESVYIVATQWHRLENPGKVPLELIEVQIGTYLGEDDIIRSEDVYHRNPDETK
jgi:mannose-1-phosphate guanylyltransferase/mannose-6-phosphate isomerase